MYIKRHFDRNFNGFVSTFEITHSRAERKEI